MIVNFADHSANERTFPAWARGAVAVVGFGLASARSGSVAPPLWPEVLMLSVGAVVVLIAYMRMRHLRRRISAVEEMDDQAVPSDTLLMLLVAGFFALLARFAVHVS